MNKVLIVSNSLDAHADEIERRLQKHSFPVVRLNTDKFMSECIKLHFQCDIKQSYLEINGVQNNLYDFVSILYRRPEQLETGVTDSYQKVFAEKESGELLKQLYQIPLPVLWVSRLDSLKVARRKLPQLLTAKRLGMNIPKTIVTNSPEEVRCFFRECDGRMIYKTLNSPIIRLGEGPELWGVPTTLLKEEQLQSIHLIQKTGGIFQEYVDKLYEVRVTVIGNDIFAAMIHSQLEESAKIDWREAVALNLVRVEPYKLPDFVENQCRSVVYSYGLKFGAIDLIRRKDGSYVFLELNCNGQWLWVEERTGQPLLESMVRLLTNLYKERR